MKVIEQDIKDHMLRPVYCLYGDEPYLRTNLKNRIRAEAVGSDNMNLAVFSGRDTAPDEIMRAAEALPFFAERRLVIVEDSGLFKRDAGRLSQFIPQMPQTTVLLFSEEQVDKRGRLYKAVVKTGHAAQLDRQPEDRLAAWLARLFSRNGRDAESRAVWLLIDLAGSSMYALEAEAEKLIAYTEGRTIVTADGVRAVCAARPEDKVFDMITAVASGNERRALGLYEDLLALKEPPMKILVLMERQYSRLLMVKEQSAAGRGADEIAAKCGLRPYGVKNDLKLVRDYTQEDLRGALELCVTADQDIKSGKMNDRIACELAISTLLADRRTGISFYGT